jgi:hypothetical protein
MSESPPVIAGLAVGIALIVFFATSSIPDSTVSVPTAPKVTEAEAFAAMKADIEERLGNASVSLYGRDTTGLDDIRNPLPLIYFNEKIGLTYRINGTSHTVISSCIPSRACFPNIQFMNADESLGGELFYFLDGAYSGEAISSPAYYFVDAMDGDVLWSYIGEDVHPELRPP